MMFTQQTEATTCPTIELRISRGVQLHEESACKPGRGAPSGNKNAETHGYYRRKIKPEAVSFDDLNFISSGGDQLPKRFIELLNHCGGEHLVSAVRASRHRARCLYLSYACAPRANSIANGHGVVANARVTSFEQRLYTRGISLWVGGRSRNPKRVVSFNNIHRSDHAFVVAAMYSGECRNRRLGRIQTDLVVQLPQHAHESIAFADDRDQCALASVDDLRPQLDRVQIEAIELGFGEDKELDDETPDSRGKASPPQYF